MGHGDAPGSQDHHESGRGVSGSSIWPLCRAHRVHPAGHGRFVSVPTCSPPPLVSFSCICYYYYYLSVI